MKRFIVTIKKANNPNHDPHSKVTGKCPVSPTCTDATGAHHSFLHEADSAVALQSYLKSLGMHVTRVEEV